MVVFNLGYTAPINRPGQSPILTASQVWAGLQLKVRKAEIFVPVIESCSVVSETGSSTTTNLGSGEKLDSDPPGDEVVSVVRYVQFRAESGLGPPDGQPVKEVCNEFPPCRVDFHQTDGSKITNFVSEGPSGAPEDLFLTYVFEWRHPIVGAGSDEAKSLAEKHRATAKMAVESTIEVLRTLVEEGRL